MSENVAQTVQKVIQDLVAPDVRELKAGVLNLQRQLDDLRKHMDQRFDAQDHFADLREKKLDAKFDSLMSAIKEGKAQSENSAAAQTRMCPATANNEWRMR